MNISVVLSWCWVIVLTITSGLFDAQGFLYASRVWENGALNVGALGRSAGGFFVGISLYYVMLRSLDALGVRAAEVQSLLWFGVTLIGVAIFRGSFATWSRVDQLVGVLVLVALAALMVRNPA
jgi:hypothetical protein